MTDFFKECQALADMNDRYDAMITAGKRLKAAERVGVHRLALDKLRHDLAMSTAQYLEGCNK